MAQWLEGVDCMDTLSDFGTHTILDNLTGRIFYSERDLHTGDELRKEQ